MNRALWAKELRAYAWALWFPVALWVIEALGVWLLDLRIHADAWWATMGMLCDVSAGIGLVLGARVARDEADAGTLVFLDGLPVSRGAVFATKVVAATAMGALAHAAAVLTVVPVHLLHPHSLIPTLPAGLLAQAVGLGAVVVAVSVALGTVVGRLGALALPVVAVAWGLLQLAVGERAGWSALVVSSLGKPRLVAGAWVPDRATLVAQAAVGVAALGLGALLFVRAGRWPRVRVPTWAVRVGWAAAGVAVLAAVPSPDGGVARNRGDVQLRDLGTLETAWFRFHYDPAQGERVRRLAGAADGIADEVSRRVGIARTEVIEVDTTGSMDNTHGTAFAGLVRLNLHGEEEETLAHETAHVLCDDRTKASAHGGWERASVFNEGLATWASRDSAEPSAVPPAVIALAQRGPFDPLQVFDAAALDRDHDVGLKYAVGVVFVEALVEVAGDGAIARLVDGFACAEAAAGAPTFGWYTAAFAEAGLDLGAVLAGMVARVEAAAAADAYVASLPRPEAVLVRGPGTVGVRVRDLDPRAVVVRFRPSPDAALSSFVTLQPDEAGVAWRGLDRVADGQVCFQAGVRIDGGAVLFEPWACLPVEAAASAEEEPEEQPVRKRRRRGGRRGR